MIGVRHVRMTEAAHKRMVYLATLTSEYHAYCEHCDLFLMDTEAPEHNCDENGLFDAASDEGIPTA